MPLSTLYYVDSGINMYRPYIGYIILCIHSCIQAISIAPLKVHYYSEALPTQHGYCVGVSRRSATGNCERRTCPTSLHGGYSGIRTHHPSNVSMHVCTYPYACVYIFMYVHMCMHV